MWYYNLLIILVIFLTLSTSWSVEINNNKRNVKNDPIKTRGLLYPFESESRELRSLDGMWRFLKSKQNATSIEEETWYKNDLDKIESTIGMPVPASYNDLTTDDSLRDHVGAVWYERKFFVSRDWSMDKRIWLRFGSVHYSAIVWLNGIEILHHSIGHLPFEAEITQNLKFGAENRLTVMCNNTLTRTTIPQGDIVKLLTDFGNRTYQTYTFDFFNYAGIHRSVVLYTTPKIYIQDILITTDVIRSNQEDTYEMELYESVGIINYTIIIAGYDSNEVHDETPSFAADLTYVHLQLRDKYGEIVAKQNCKEMPFNGSIIVDDANLWWPYLMNLDYGYLYTLEVYLHASTDNSLLDVYRMKIGIRKVEWDNSNLRLNGQNVYLHGFGRHEDSDLRGKGLDYALITRDFNLLKWVGANAYRTSHYPYSEESMQFADENGIMIIDECSSVNTDYFSPELMHNHKSALEQLIHRDRNHPSVIMWSIANEPRTATNQSEAYFREIVKYAKTLDKTRPLTAAINVEIGKDKLAQFLDIISFNRYNAWYRNVGHLDMIKNSVIEEATNWRRKYNKPILMSEYGADTMEGLHSLPESIWSEDYQIQLLGKHFKAFDDLRQKKWFIGEFLWNFADFKTEQGAKLYSIFMRTIAEKTLPFGSVINVLNNLITAITRVGGNKKGIFTRSRQPKSAAHLLRKRYFGLCSELYECDIPTDFLQ